MRLASSSLRNARLAGSQVNLRLSSEQIQAAWEVTCVAAVTSAFARGRVRERMHSMNSRICSAVGSYLVPWRVGAKDFRLGDTSIFPLSPVSTQPSVPSNRLLQEPRPPQLWRSEEHTSELQSLRHLVCRLLLEKNSMDLRRHSSKSDAVERRASSPVPQPNTQRRALPPRPLDQRAAWRKLFFKT